MGVAYWPLGPATGLTAQPARRAATAEATPTIRGARFRRVRSVIKVQSPVQHRARGDVPGVRLPGVDDDRVVVALNHDVQAVADGGGPADRRAAARGRSRSGVAGGRARAGAGIAG